MKDDRLKGHLDLLLLAVGSMQQVELAWGRWSRGTAGTMWQQGDFIAIEDGGGRREAATATPAGPSTMISAR